MCKMGTTLERLCARRERRWQGYAQEENDVAMLCARRERRKKGYVQEGNDISKAMCKKGTTLARLCARRERL